MKSIENIKLTGSSGQQLRDTAPDLLPKEHLDLFREGKPLPDDAGVLIDSVHLIRRLIDLSKYKTRNQQKKADKIYEKVEAKDGQVLLEDDEYEMLSQMLQNFDPYLNGRIYTPFFEAMEAAKDVSVLPEKQDD